MERFYLDEHSKFNKTNFWKYTNEVLLYANGTIIQAIYNKNEYVAQKHLFRLAIADEKEYYKIHLSTIVETTIDLFLKPFFLMGDLLEFKRNIFDVDMDDLLKSYCLRLHVYGFLNVDRSKFLKWL